MPRESQGSQTCNVNQVQVKVRVAKVITVTCICMTTALHRDRVLLWTDMWTGARVAASARVLPRRPFAGWERPHRALAHSVLTTRPAITLIVTRTWTPGNSMDH
jgi:hypothetical protein